MASYQTQILDAPPQYGFLPGLASGMASGGEKFSNLYAESMMKDMLAKKEAKKKQEAINAFQAAMKNDSSMEMDQVSMDESGNPKYTYKKKKTPESAYEKDPMKMIKQAMGGILPGAQMEQLGQAQGIQPQQHMDRNYASLINQAILNPAQTSIAPAPRGVMDMVNLPTKPVYDPQLTGPMNAQGGRFMEYPDVVRQENLKKFASGFTEEQVKRDVMGLSVETPAEKLAAEQVKEQKKQPVYDPATTATVKQNIRTAEDIDELLKNRKDYEDAGVDVISILKEYLMTNPEPGIIDKIKSFLAD